MDTQPFHDYLRARDAMRDGDRELALKLIRASLGAEGRATPMLANNLDTLMDPESEAGDLMLQLVAAEIRRKR